MEQPQQYAPPPAPEKKSNTTMIVIIVVVVVLVLCCCCLIGGYFGLQPQIQQIFEQIQSSMGTTLVPALLPLVA